MERLGLFYYGNLNVKVFLIEDNSSKNTRAGKFIKIDPFKNRQKQQVIVCLFKLKVLVFLFIS